MNSFSTLAIATAAFLGGCVSQPIVVDSAHPASTDAPEASGKLPRNNLRPDTASKRTQSLLAEREREASAAESETPADQIDIRSKTTPAETPPPSGAPAGAHEHHE